MKTIICICVMLLGVAALHAQQLSPDFYNQFKAIFTGQWYEAKGTTVLKTEKENNVTTTFSTNREEKRKIEISKGFTSAVATLYNDATLDILITF